MIQTQGNYMGFLKGKQHNRPATNNSSHDSHPLAGKPTQRKPRTLGLRDACTGAYKTKTEDPKTKTPPFF